MSLVISLLIFGFAVYLFVVTISRIKQIENGAIDSRFKKEMESLVVEFNAAATRNIAMLEQKTEELQSLLQRANQKLVQLDERIDRVGRPIVVEKIVEKKVEQQVKVPPKAMPSQSKTGEASQEKGEVVRLSREEMLKKHLRDGKNREELLAMGFFENEINLVMFLYKNEMKS